MAVKRRCPDSGLLHHSDRAGPYASEDYQTLLEMHGIPAGASATTATTRGDGSLFSIVKSELREPLDSSGEAKMELFDYIDVFDNHGADTQRSARSVPRRLNARPRSLRFRYAREISSQTTCLLNSLNRSLTGG